MFYKGALWNNIEKLGITASCLGMRGALDISGMYRLYRHLVAGDYDIVHVHHIHPAVSMLVGWLRGSNVYTEHGGGLLGGGRLEKLVYKWFHMNYCRFIAISREMGQVMTAVNPVIRNKIQVIHNGVDLDKIDALAAAEVSTLPALFGEAPLRVGIIGRLEPQKRIDTFIETASLIATKRGDVIFPVIGDGSLLESLTAKSKQLGIGEKVLFLGYRTNAIAIMKHFDIFLFTSDYEPFGLVIVEAMAAGIPVVALHKQGAIPEIIDDGIEGYVVKTGGAVALAERAMKLLADPGLRKRMARAARLKVEAQFTMQHNASRVLTAYHECLKPLKTGGLKSP